ncbi:MAG: hypothetical protein Alpg2KO_06960 [Alphaproteobacteria bacterium]
MTEQRKDLAPLEKALTTRRRDAAEVDQAREARQEHGQVDGVADNALVRLSEMSRQKLSVQVIVNASGKAAAGLGRKMLKPVTPSKAPSNTPWAKLLRRIAMRGMVDGVYRQNGELIYAGTSDNILTQAKRSGEALTDLDAYGVKLKESDLSGAKLERADFRDGWIGHVDFSGADLTEARFARTKITGWFSPGDRWDRSAMTTNMRNARLTRADFRKATLIGVQFDGAELKGADFTGAKFDDFSVFRDKADVAFAAVMSMTGLGIPVAYFTGMYADAMRRDKCHTRFSGADLEGARFSIDAPFDKLGLTSRQRGQIVLVDRRGNVRDDLGVADDGSLFLRKPEPEPVAETEALPKA